MDGRKVGGPDEDENGKNKSPPPSPQSSVAQTTGRAHSLHHPWEDGWSSSSYPTENITPSQPPCFMLLYLNVQTTRLGRVWWKGWRGDCSFFTFRGTSWRMGYDRAPRQSLSSPCAQAAEPSRLGASSSASATQLGEKSAKSASRLSLLTHVCAIGKRQVCAPYAPCKYHVPDKHIAALHGEYPIDSADWGYSLVRIVVEADMARRVTWREEHLQLQVADRDHISFVH